MHMKSLPVVVMLALAAAMGAAPQSVDEMKAHAEAATGAKQIELYCDLAKRLLDLSDRDYIAGNVSHGQALFFESATYAEKASKEARESGKRLKQTEIALRKLTEKMQEIKRTLNLEDRAPLDSAIQQVEQSRSKLLERMFGKEAR